MTENVVNRRERQPGFVLNGKEVGIRSLTKKKNESEEMFVQRMSNRGYALEQGVNNHWSGNELHIGQAATCTLCAGDAGQTADEVSHVETDMTPILTLPIHKVEKKRKYFWIQVLYQPELDRIGDHVTVALIGGGSEAAMPPAHEQAEDSEGSE